MILILLFLSSFVEATSYIAPTQSLSQKGTELWFQGDYFQSQKKIDKLGNKVDFKEGETFKRFQSELRGYYGFSKEFTVGVGVRLRQQTSELELGTNPYTYTTLEAQGLQSTLVHLLYAFEPINKTRYALEFSYRFVPYTNKEAQLGEGGEELVLGDDGAEISAGLGVSFFSTSGSSLTLRGLYRNPGTDLSQEIFLQSEAALAWSKFALVAGVEAVKSLQNDAYTDDPLNKPFEYTANTELYNSINREWVTPYGGFNFLFNPHWRLEARAGQTISGRSTDFGFFTSLALVRRKESNAQALKMQKEFKTYDVEASVIKVSKNKGFVLIDKGIGDDVEISMRFDIYETDYLGKNQLVASGLVMKVQADSSIVKITQRYLAKMELKEGLTARGMIRLKKLR